VKKKVQLIVEEGDTKGKIGGTYAGGKEAARFAKDQKPRSLRFQDC